MPDIPLLELSGAPPPRSKHTPLATVKFIGGLQTQRSPFASIDTRYNSRFLGGKPDSLIAGYNVEVSNALTLMRRYGLTAYGPTIPAPLAFYTYEQSAPPGLQTIVDTATAVYLYSPTAAGIVVYKSAGAGQTNFWTVVNTLYFGDGVDLFKLVGPNLLTQSNSFSSAPWTSLNAAFTTGQFDPVGGTAASNVSWAPFTGASAYLQQAVTPNYTPVAGNTFTASIWLRAISGSSSHVTLYLQDQTGATVASTVIALTQTWTKYQVTGTMGAGATQVVFNLGNPDTTATLQLYGAQLEIGGPASPTQLTTTQPQGVYLWGIVAPTTPPSLSQTVLSAFWANGHVYSVGDTITDNNGNLETVTIAGTSGATVPTWPLLAGTLTAGDGGVSGVTWVQGGPNGLSPKTGYKWYFAFLDQYTGQPSNVSPVSPSTAIFANNLGVSYLLSGSGSTDPQVNQIALYRNVDGGAFWYQEAVFPNPPGGGTWTFVDTIQDINLSSIFAPIGLLNSPPPAGAINPIWHQSRMWVSVGSLLYYSAGPDNASLLNIVQNGVIAESFAYANVIPLDKPIVRSFSTSAGLIVETTSDIWLVPGTDLTSFNPVKVLVGHGCLSYNASCMDGGTIWVYTSDRQFLSASSSAGSLEIGFPIGDLIQANINPANAYVVRHISGSVDNAVFLGDGATGWFRLNPNQIGASVSGEQSPVWSPFAVITGGAQALGSIETSPGVHQLLVGTPGVGGGSILSLGQLAGTGANSGAGVAWSNPNSVTLGNSATPASVELNTQVVFSTNDVEGGATGSGTSVSTGSVTTGVNNELGITAIFGTNSVVEPGTAGGTLTHGGSWTLDYQSSGIYNKLILIPGKSEPIDYYFTFGSEHQSLATAGAIAGTATISKNEAWSAVIATFKTGSGTAPTVVQKASASAYSPYAQAPSYTQLQKALTTAVTKGNFLVVAAGTSGDANALSLTDNLGNVFSPIQVTGQTAIFLAPITSSSAIDTIALNSTSTVGALAMTVYEITLPPAASGPFSSQLLQATNFNLNIPNNNITGVKVYVTGSQSSSSPDVTFTLSWIGAVGAPSYTFQLPTTSGTLSFGGTTSTWGQTLTAALLNATSFGFQLQANVAVTPNVTFNLSAVWVQISYLNASPVTYPVLFRDLTVFADNGTPFTWSATIGSLVLAAAGSLAETESITTQVRAANGVQPTVAVALGEIAGPFETLANPVNDPPQLAPSASVISNRFYLSQGTVPPLCQHAQIQLSGGATATRDELLSLTIRGALVPEQE